jgi:spore photoproduct lyase
MNQKLSDYDNIKESLSTKQRNAAIKAWKTIKHRERISAAKDSFKIDRYLSPNKLMLITHPEMPKIRKNNNNEVLSYSKGIISLFHKTPPDICCGNFWEIRWAYGCPLDCNYCYLRGTMRGNMKPTPLKIEHVLDAIDEAFQNIKQPSIFNSGELSDSLMYPWIMQKIVDKFEQQNKHKILLLSKMGPRNIGFLLERLRKQTVCAWSINAIEIAKKWEKAAAIPEERITAAKMMSDLGYDTRIRIDPIFPIENWKLHYEDILYRIFSNIEPKKVILGTPRGLWKTIKYAKDAKIDMSWIKFFKEDSSWGRKLQFDQRKEIYQFFYDKLNSMGYPSSRVTLCKETVRMWNEMRLEYSPMTCNCYGQKALM